MKIVHKDTRNKQIYVRAYSNEPFKETLFYKDVYLKWIGEGIMITYKKLREMGYVIHVGDDQTLKHLQRIYPCKVVRDSEHYKSYVEILGIQRKRKEEGKSYEACIPDSYINETNKRYETKQTKGWSSIR